MMNHIDNMQDPKLPEFKFRGAQKVHPTGAEEPCHTGSCLASPRHVEHAGKSGKAMGKPSVHKIPSIVDVGYLEPHGEEPVRDVFFTRYSR